MPKASSGSIQIRHFKALSRKNWINWKRTPTGNLLELCCPIVLTLFMYAARCYILMDYWQEFDLTKLHHGIYPPSSRTLGGEYKTNMKEMVNMAGKIEDFVVHGLGAPKEVGYMPFADVTGPLLFFPQQCTPVPDSGIYGSPIIAYIKDDNPVQKQMVDQVKSHFDTFGTIIDMVMENDIFLATVEAELTKMKNKDTIEAEAISKVVDAQVNHWSGNDRRMTNLKFPEMKFYLQPFETKQILEDYISHPQYGYDAVNRPAVCFMFHLMEKAKDKFELELMFNDQIVLDYRSIPNQMDQPADQNQLFPMVRSYAYYSYYGFAYMQNWAANTILKFRTDNQYAEIVAMTIPFKLKPMVKDPFSALVYFILPHFIMLMFIPLIYRLTYRIVREKELRTKEMMAEMGMKTFSFWMSWAVYFTCVNFLMSTCSWIVLYFGCFIFTGPLVLWLCIFLYGQSIFGFIMLLQSFFSEARTAAVTTTIVYFGSALTLQLGEQAPTWQKFLMALSPCSCMQQTVKVIAGFESNGVGITMGTLTQSYRNFNTALGFGMFICSFFIMNILGIYFDNVVPRKYGKSYPMCYCLASAKKKTKRSLKKLNRRINNLDEAGGSTDYVSQSRKFETRNTDPANYEGVPHNIAQMEEFSAILKISDMWKQYSNGMKAVNGINLKMYTDQIFVLLGHNGAGKSSLIACLTGLYEPSKGTAEVFGVDMITEFDKVRQFLGICPQHDVYFDLLTPREHLDLFYDFKGGDPDPEKKNSEIEGLIKSIGLTDQQHNLTSTLSGGYQRKLSVCLALVGGSKLIIMDEPTSALDANARRSIWTCLKEYKKDRIVLLTTHYMDEADILGDRVAIMTKGKVTCLGSSLFLKRKFGVGYNLQLIKNTPAVNNTIEAYFLEKLGPGSKKTTENASEIIMQVPLDYSTQFKSFFDEFDKVLKEFEIDSYSLSITTLEDVFLKVGHLADFDSRKESTPTPALQNSSTTKDFMNDTPGLSTQEMKPIRLTNRDADGKLTDTIGSHIDTQSYKIQGNLQPGRNSAAFEALESERKSITQQPMFKDKKGDALASHHSEAYYTEDQEKPLQRDMYETPDFADTPGEMQPYSMAQHGTDNSFTSTFVAVILKRMQLWQSSKKMLYEFLLPILIIVVGISLSSIDMYKRSESRLLDPTRVSSIPAGQTLLFNRDVTLAGGDVTVEELAKRFPAQEQLDIVMKNATADFENDAFETFQAFTHWYGVSFRSTWPFFYASYQVYEADTRTHQYKFFNFINLTNSDSAALYPQYMYEAILKTAMNDDEMEFKCRNTPMPITNEMRKRKVQGNAAAVIFLTAVSYGMLMTSIVGGIVWERMSGIKHMQMISGLNRPAYWMANFIVDLIQVEVIVMISILAFYYANLKYSTCWIVYMMFPLAAIPLTYVTSFLFQSESAAQTGTIFMNFGSILFGSTLVHYLRFIKEWEVIGDFLNNFFKLLPSYTLGASIYFDSSMEDLVEFRDATLGEGKQLNPDPFTLENLYGDMLSLVLHFVFWTLVLVIIELGAEKSIKKCLLACHSRKFPVFTAGRFDSDVEQEARRVNNESEPGYLPDEETQLKVKEMRKMYIQSGEPICAIEKLSFGIQKGECFALLGVNGAGKSTTFKILTGDEESTEGEISIQGLDIKEDFQQVRKLIGYCPQRDPLFEQLTVEQNIEYFARIKGIPSKYRRFLIENVINRMSLTDHRKKPSGTLSGGNKRKLSVAISIVGNPSIILLDEPSSGMDPEARRFMWSVINEITSSKSSAVIFSSRLMDEAEALSTKMGIMITGGMFKCFGSAHHIKEKFGKEKYEIELKIAVPSHEQLLELAKMELAPFIDEDKKIEMIGALRYLKTTCSRLILDKIIAELIITYKQSKYIAAQIRTLREDVDNIDDGVEKVLKCSSIVFIEKLFTQRNMYGSIESICKQWKPSQEAIDAWMERGVRPEEDPSKIELLEQYGNYCKLRLSRQEKTLGQMFGMIDDIKDRFMIEQYSISAMKLEQIFQSLVNDNFDLQVKTFELATDAQGNEELQIN